VLRALVAETHETALLSVLQGARSYTIPRERSPHSLQAGGRVGRTSPLHVTASGRALLLDRSDEEIGDLIAADIDSAEYGPHALRSLPDVLNRLHQERSNSCTVAAEELEIGLVAIGAPIRDSTGQIIAAINVSGPTSRMLNHIDTLSTAAHRLGAAATRRVTTAISKPHWTCRNRQRHRPGQVLPSCPETASSSETLAGDRREHVGVLR